VKILKGKRVLFGKVVLCESFWSKFIGLMGRPRKLAAGECLLFVENREKSPLEMSIHMTFCFFPITVAWLDSGGRVVSVARAAPFSILDPRTWKLYLPSGPSQYIVECSEGAKLSVREKLSLSRRF
jgi:uncharacterized membrane protein (UPF0127 family)